MPMKNRNIKEITDQNDKSSNLIFKYFLFLANHARFTYNPKWKCDTVNIASRAPAFKDKMNLFSNLRWISYLCQINIDLFRNHTTRYKISPMCNIAHVI